MGAKGCAKEVAGRNALCLCCRGAGFTATSGRTRKAMATKAVLRLAPHVGLGRWIKKLPAGSENLESPRSRGAPSRFVVLGPAPICPAPFDTLLGAAKLVGSRLPPD